ncbi:MAG TPA: FlgD immunoglobulin-like domain containing protein, partial [Candidatus Limnocylindria bacterium]|nr:FlgD immunoglobulin-like domain containing protein [Candidatus Limnocylindria bacterium]
RVYDVRGHLVTTLIDGELSAGPQTASWDGRDHARNAVASGIYFYQLTSGGSSETRRMLLVR